MANFLFYKYSFEKETERNLFSASEGNKEVTAEFLNEKLREDLSEKYHKTSDRNLGLYATKTDKSGIQNTENYTNEISGAYGDIFLIQVRNNKSKKVMPVDKTEPEDIGHFPFCWVIIDTRPASQCILIQFSQSIFKNSDFVLDLLADYFSREYGLPALGWKFTTIKRICSGTIWDIIRTRTHKDQDRVKSVTIKLSEKRPNPQSEVDRALQLVLEKLASPEGALTLTNNDPAKKLLDETMEDVRNTIDLLVENQYKMTVGFEKSGSVEYGKQAEAVYGIADQVCKTFEEGETTFSDDGSTTTALEIWLDTLIPEDNYHQYTEIEKRNGRRKAN